ncbi:AAA family ATPase [Cronbergia sp. UHCC 0137]|uniref:AAA family ATPase n=1 Tax=Cronbergia sp. UHCC 0137 TaxID=3110239 RepID=UPI002B206740|nr:AAA family ATPase [Cronbergia sp. UHCC 0137]MEA5617328.1 AAA family ATPase [Cronbergia sp. UHCC 0137]
MKIKFSNLGSIQETELDLRPLTVIIGPNNSGKTYIAYSTYGLWQRVRRTLNIYKGQLDFKEEDYGGWSLQIDNNLLDFFIRDAEEMAKSFQGSSLESFFQDSSHKLFSKTLFSIIISRQEVEDAINILTQQESFHLEILYLEYGIPIKLKLSRQNNKLLFRLQSNNGENNINENRMLIEYFQDYHQTNTPEIYFIDVIKQIIFSAKMFPFPAERNAFINTYKILANRRYRLLKETQRELLINSSPDKQIELLKEQGNISYPQPVEDFLDFLTEIELQEEVKINSNEQNEFQKLADEIEKQLQNKNKTNLKPTKLHGKEIKVLVKKGLEIDLYNASSSIKQLAPLLLYLRYRANKGDFLVIDEPEMNLHPESQAKLLEALSILVNLGVRILLTTHSPYIMAHLNNLVNGNHENPEILKRQSSSLYLQDERAFLPMDKVSAYEMKDNKLVSLNDPDYGIRWDTLSDVSVDIQQKFFQIYEAGQEKADEAEE